jgi:hypothetical protein
VTEPRLSGPPSCQPGKRVQRTRPEPELGWATSWQQGRTIQGRVGTAHYAHEREQTAQQQHDPPGDWWGPKPPLVSGQIPPGNREPAPVPGFGVGRTEASGGMLEAVCCGCSCMGSGREKEVDRAPAAGEAEGGGDGEVSWGTGEGGRSAGVPGVEAEAWVAEDACPRGASQRDLTGTEEGSTGGP